MKAEIIDTLARKVVGRKSIADGTPQKPLRMRKAQGFVCDSIQPAATNPRACGIQERSGPELAVGGFLVHKLRMNIIPSIGPLCKPPGQP
jgi:hypothetical protein